jgi:hypothetical protein
MRREARLPLRPGPDDVSRNPVACALTTAVMAVVFWVGLIWLALWFYG